MVTSLKGIQIAVSPDYHSVKMCNHLVLRMFMSFSVFTVLLVVCTGVLPLDSCSRWSSVLLTWEFPQNALPQNLTQVFPVGTFSADVDS